MPLGEGGEKFLINEHFKQHVDSLHPKFEKLIQSVPFTFGTLPKEMPKAGVYLFTEGESHLYVGRTNSLRNRLQQHCRAGSSHNSSPFAFRLARELRGVLKASYKVEGSRAALIQDAAFAEAFVHAKARLREMKIRVVEEDNPLRQALLEMYVAIALDAKYNDFDNH
jgi:predicted GIY-YIG superfamily endonuclease